MGGIKVDSKFWSLARLQRAVADNCKTDDDLIRLECLQRVTTEARYVATLQRKIVHRYEISRRANLVGRGSVAEIKTGGRRDIIIMLMFKYDTGLKEGLRARVALMHAVVRIR